ncbi:hypothetical protein N658DRAFT_509895 [Parathielavia hyrcaniae]|uniref:Uncharacterized protein n=1 Tax=Parathielavia hyrcaniae TaxID=113614 RepID=A0AAN6PUQ2_9PEZI|nr:hypothetical protein N658DRAFT_509895 [Parathielavia hyrcaniae]
MTDQHTGAGEGRRALRPPPGFENTRSNRRTEAGEASAAPTPEEQPSSTLSSSARGSAHGLFPLPSASDFSPPSSTTSASSGRSTLPEVSSEYRNRDKMEATNAFFFGHHHHQLVAIMTKKFQDLLDYDKTKNRKILHIDWIAGNPSDPIKKEGGDAAHGGMSAEDRRLSESVARSVMRITYNVPQWDETMTWNKSMFFGDWLSDHKGFRQYFIEIHVKRISGADDAMLHSCGISPEYVWLSLHNDKAPALMPIVLPPIMTQQVRSQAPSRELPTPGQTSSEDMPEVEQREYATPAHAPATVPSMIVPTCSADKGKGKATAPPDKPVALNPEAPVFTSSQQAAQTVGTPSQSAQSPQRRTPLPNIGTLALGQQASADQPIPSVETTAPRTGIPRSQHLPATGSFNSFEAEEPDDPRISPTSSASSYEDEGTVYLAENVDPFEALIPAHAAPAISAADLHRHRQEYDRSAHAKREELKKTFHFLQNPAFIERKNKSFVYAVRVVAVPDRGHVVNDLTGPRIDDRYGTLLGQGGWVVPPAEKRAQWRDEHKRSYRNKGAKLGRYEGIPRPQVQHAMPLRLDWTGGLEARYFGPVAPVWRELCDPCLEDVYWMVWQLMSGKQFLGFNPGNGFGVARRDPMGEEPLLRQCPFKSPSAEALFHAASYPRGKEC